MNRVNENEGRVRKEVTLKEGGRWMDTAEYHQAVREVLEMEAVGQMWRKLES